MINQRKVGLSHARNTGWQRAKGQYVAYIDDDAIADKDWVNNILSFIKQHPNVKAFGGPYLRHHHRPMPTWMPPNYGQNNPGRGVRPLNIGQEFLSGTNMIFHRSLLQKIGGFDPAYGMVGNRLNYGEETQLQLRLAREGIEVWWDDRIQVSHLLHERKMNPSWLIKEAFITGIATQRMMNEYPDVFSKAKQQPRQENSATPRYTAIQQLIKSLQLGSYALGRMYGMIINK